MPPTDSTLLSDLQTSNDSERLHSLVSDYLRPISAVANSKKTSKKVDQAAVRSLAKLFLAFLSKSCPIIYNRLHIQNPDQQQRNSLSPLFDTYRLCITCLEFISFQLEGGPHLVQIQRLKLVYCLHAWGRYEEGESEAFRVLERLRGESNSKDKVVPSTDVGGRDAKFGSIVVEAVASVVKNVAMGQSKDPSKYERLIVLLVQARPWYRELEADAFEKSHIVLVTFLGRCCRFLVEQINNFGEDLVRRFFVECLTEYLRSSMRDQIHKFARRICSYLFSVEGSESSVHIDFVMFVLASIFRECKVEIDCSGIEYVKIVDYCANKCRAACAIFCSTLARHLNNIAGDFHQAIIPIDLILRLYALSLELTEHDVKMKCDDPTTSSGAEDGSAIKVLFLERDKLQNMSALLGSLGNYFKIGKQETSISSDIKLKNFVNQMHLQPESRCQSSTICKETKTSLVLYYNTLKFLCQPLAEVVNSKKKQILAETEASSDSSKLYIIQDAFFQFCDSFFSLESCTSETGREEFDEDEILLSSVIVAGFILSIYTKRKMQKSVHLLKQIIGSGWIQCQGLKYLFISLYNIGVLMYRSGQTKEALKALKLSCTASWKNIQLLCEMFTNKKGCDDHLSEHAIRDLVTDACARSAFLLEVLHACGNIKVKKIIVESLENWSAAENLFGQLPGPMPLIKQWVKIQCKLHNDKDIEDTAPTLYCMLMPPAKVSKRLIGIILEQELLAYHEMNHRYPEFCQRMQIKVIDFLMQDAYAFEDSPLRKARILIRKGRLLRANGIESLKTCIQCLSEAISVMKNFYVETRTCGASACHQLAAAYCLRALCTQEAEPNSEQLYQDTCAAIDMWLSIFVPDRCSVDDELKLVSGNTLPLLYNILDLLSMKGYTKLHTKIYELIFRLYKGNNLQLGKCLANLWECRRLSHALCFSPVNDAFIIKLSENCGENSKFIDFWIDCLSRSQPGLLGFQQNLTSSFNTLNNGFKNHERDFQSAIMFNNVKRIASELISTEPVHSHSIFLAGYIYYDLCERLISTGQLFEGLLFAKEAFRLRSELFKRKFTFSIKKKVEKDKDTGDIGEVAETVINGLKKLQVNRIVASDLWSFESTSWDLYGHYLSPWNVLQSYLESILQVGYINEMAGNGTEAETFLSWGKKISCSQGLPLFEAAFSSVLGRLYRKKKLWDAAEKELKSAKKILADSSSCYSCTKCMLLLEVNIDQQLGDLFCNLFDSSIINNLSERLSQAEYLYKSAIEKLNHSKWMKISCDEQSDENATTRTSTVNSEDFAGKAAFNYPASQPDANGARKNRKTKNVSKSVLKEQHMIPEQSSRVTRSRLRSSQNQSINTTSEAQVAVLKHSNGNVMSKTPDNFWEKESLLGKGSCMNELSGDISCICKRTKCWHCIPTEIMKSGLLSSFINMKWEYARRKLLVRLLIGIGKCLGYHAQAHEIHEVVWQTVSVLVSRNTFTQICPSSHGTFLLDLIGSEIKDDTFAVERALILYNIGWVLAKNFHSKNTRIVCCDLCNVQLPMLVYWLKLAFVLCREVPVLSQKVSILLSVMYLLSASNKNFSLPPCKTLSDSHWASYFHQASLGNHFNHQFFPDTCGRSNTQCFVDSMDMHASNSSCTHSRTSTLLRLAPESINDLEEFVMNFYAGLPCTAIICISLLGHAYASLLQELLLYPCIHAWLLLSRLNSKDQPVVLLLPLDPVLAEADDATPDDDDDARACQELRECMSLGVKWHCPWGSTVVDDVAPAFKVILQENFIISSCRHVEDTKTTRSLWWMIRKKVDYQLGNLLSNLENMWLGPWRHVLLGDWLDRKSLNTVHKKLVRDLKSKCKIGINESFLKLVLGGANFDGEEAWLSMQCLKTGCYIGLLENNKEENHRSDGDKVSALASQLICEAMNELHLEDTVSREPIILVLDRDIQMLPWESLPVLRKQEVYRMPSVGSITLTLERSLHYQEQVGRNSAALPLIDPLDAFYLLNPSGDLRQTQDEFENWFRDQNFKGKAGSVPTAEELVTALKSHDLFLYFGHGSGEQYLSKDQIQKLDKCAATLLMGCSSGSLTLNGCYVPRGISLSYLRAGSPVIIANLWEVTDKDIDRFGKAVLNSWLRERLTPTDCSQCNNLLAKEFEAMRIKGRKGNSRKKAASSESDESTTNAGSASLKFTCDHRPKIGSFVGQARETCILPFLNGASPVCYGVPTGIRRKKDL